MKKSFNNHNISSSFRSSQITLAVIILSGIFFITGCMKEEVPHAVDSKYLVEFEKINNYNASFVKIMLGSMNAAYPGIDTLLNDVEYSIDIYKIKYNSTYKGNPVVVSGLVSIPISDENFPVVSFQNGTNTYKLNAPTINPSDPLYTLLEMMASHGYVVAISDYLGFGISSNMLHPYYDKVSTTQVIVDMIRATHELLDQSEVAAGSNGDHYLMGYSQGGWATLSALHELETNHSDSIPIKAASCGAGAYDITKMSDYVLAQSVYPGPLYLPYFIHSKITAGDMTQPLADFFKEPYASSIPTLFDGTFTNSEVNDQLTDTIASLVTDELRLNLTTSSQFATLRNLMVGNSVNAWNTSSTIRFYHGTNDRNVPPEQSDLIYNRFLANGVSPSKVTLVPIPDASHESGLIPWGISTILWFDAIH